MSGLVPQHPVIVGLAAFFAATAVVQAGDGEEGQFWRHTHPERPYGGIAQVETWNGRDIPDYRVVRAWPDDAGRAQGGSEDGDAAAEPSQWRAPPPIIFSSGRYSGNVAAWYRRGVGSTFTISRYDEAPQPVGRSVAWEGPVKRHGATSRVITVGKAAARRNDQACSFEAGVCVIRGR